MMLTARLRRLACQRPQQFRLPPVCGRIATNCTSGKRAGSHVCGQLIFSVLRPVDKDLVVIQGPVRVSRECGTLEVIVPICLELHWEAPARPLEVPLRPCTVANQHGLQITQRSKELRLAPVVLVGLILRNSVPRHGPGLAVQGELVLPEFLPVDKDNAIPLLPLRGLLELRTKKGSSRPKAHLETPTLPNQGPPSDDVPC
mmetsp:Transcript_35135/g.93664  ORF Transcript_35135/g.93664 Transcript_35135/m.93664 type:complete len:201 (+) Transcript_35135:127-729(+)